MVEQTVLFPVGAFIDLEGHINGSKRVECKRWNTRKSFQCGKITGEILASLFPNDALFLLSIEWGKPLTASAQLYDILFNRIYDNMVRLVCYTLDIIEDPDIRQFIETTTPMDVLTLFVTVINQEINNSNVEAIIKKAQGLLVEKFRLDSDSLSLPNILAALLQTHSTDSPLISLLSSLTTPKSTSSEDG